MKNIKQIFNLIKREKKYLIKKKLILINFKID